MSGLGAKAYQRIDVDSGVTAADPHRLVLLLYDGALEAIRLGAMHMVAGRVADKGQALGKAVRIVEEGLKASLDRDAGGQLAFRLLDLYDYMVMRLLQANLRNDEAALTEVATLLGDLRDAWAQIRPAVSVPPTVAAATPPAAAPGPSFFDGSNRGPVRRLMVTA